MDNVNRRSFLKVVGVGLCGCVTASILAACDKDEEIAAPAIPSPENYPSVSIADFPALTAVGGIIKTLIKNSKGVTVNSGNPLILYRASDTKFVVLDTTCLHASKEVSISSSGIFCPLHGATFAKETGAVTDPSGAGSGFNQPLKSFKSTFDSIKNTLTIQI